MMLNSIKLSFKFSVRRLFSTTHKNISNYIIFSNLTCIFSFNNKGNARCYSSNIKSTDFIILMDTRTCNRYLVNLLVLDSSLFILNYTHYLMYHRRSTEYRPINIGYYVQIAHASKISLNPRFDSSVLFTESKPYTRFFVKHADMVSSDRQSSTHILLLDPSTNKQYLVPKTLANPVDSRR